MQRIAKALQHPIVEERGRSSAGGFRENDETVGITLWNNKSELDAYVKDTDAQVVKLLEPFITGTPDVRTYEVSASTSHKYPAA